METKGQEKFIDRFKREHQGNWLNSSKAVPFLTEFSKRLSTAGSRVAIPQDRAAANLQLYNEAMDNLPDEVDEHGKPVMGGRFISMHGGPIDFMSQHPGCGNKYRDVAPVFQVPPNQVVVIYTPRGTVVKGDHEQDIASWLFFKQKYFPAAAFIDSPDTCYGADRAGFIPGDIPAEILEQYVEAPEEMEKAKKAVKKASGIAETESARKQLEKIKIKEAIQEQATKLAEKVGVIDEYDWEEFWKKPIWNPSNSNNDGHEILWDMQMFFGGNPDLWNNDTNTPLPGYDGDWVYNQHQQFEVLVNPGGGITWDPMFNNYKLGNPTDALVDGLWEAPIGIQLPELDGNAHNKIYRGHNTTNLVQVTPQTDPDNIMTDINGNYIINDKVNGAMTIDEYDNAEVTTTRDDAPEGAWRPEIFLTPDNNPVQTQREAVLNNAYICNPFRAFRQPEMLLVKKSVHDLTQGANPHLIKNIYRLDDERRSLYARTPYRKHPSEKTSGDDPDPVLYKYNGTPFQSPSFICPFFNNGEHLPQNQSQKNSGTLEGIRTSNLAEYTSLLGCASAKDDTSKSYSTTEEMILMNYKARRGRPGISVISSCAPHPLTGKIRGRHFARHASHTPMNLAIRTFCQGIGRNIFFDLRQKIGTSPGYQQHGAKIFIPQWREHKGITIMDKDDRTEFYIILGNYFKQVQNCETLFDPIMFLTLATTADSDPTNKVRTHFQYVYDRWYSGQQIKRGSNAGQIWLSLPSIMAYKLLPYDYEITLWDKRSQRPIIGHDVQRGILFDQLMTGKLGDWNLNPQRKQRTNEQLQTYGKALLSGGKRIKKRRKRKLKNKKTKRKKRRQRRKKTRRKRRKSKRKR